MVEKLIPVDAVEPGQSRFQTIFLYTYRTVLQPRQLFEKMVERFVMFIACQIVPLSLSS